MSRRLLPAMVFQFFRQKHRDIELYHLIPHLSYRQDHRNLFLCIILSIILLFKSNFSVKIMIKAEQPQRYFSIGICSHNPNHLLVNQNLFRTDILIIVIVTKEPLPKAYRRPDFFQIIRQEIWLIHAAAQYSLPDCRTLSGFFDLLPSPLQRGAPVSTSWHGWFDTVASLDPVVSSFS